MNNLKLIIALLLLALSFQKASASSKHKKRKASAPKHVTFVTDSGRKVSSKELFPGKIYTHYSNDKAALNIQKKFAKQPYVTEELKPDCFTLVDFTENSKPRPKLGHGLKAAKDLKKFSFVPYPGKVVKKSEISKSEKLSGSCNIMVADSNGEEQKDYAYAPMGYVNESHLFQHAPESISNTFRLAKSVDLQSVQEANATITPYYTVMLKKDIAKNQPICIDYGPEYWELLQVIPSLFYNNDHKVIDDSLSKPRYIKLEFHIKDKGSISLSVEPIDLMLKIIFNRPIILSAQINGVEELFPIEREDMIMSIKKAYSDEIGLSRIFSDIFYKRYLTGKSFPSKKEDLVLHIASLPYDQNELEESIKKHRLLLDDELGFDLSDIAAVRKVLKRTISSPVKYFW
jgi:hypothetical protein